ncbi:MAG TPA: ABC transporter substrate-binding protein [Gemmatimonadales bacterium]
MRIASLLPAATEIVCAIGAADQLVGISHECDWPPGLDHLPRITSSPVDSAGPGHAIDAAVRALVAAGRPVIAVDPELLRELRPDLLLVQDLCEVCAVAEGGVRRLAEVLDPVPVVLPLRGRTLAGVADDIRTLGAFLGRAEEADEVAAGVTWRLRRLARTRPEATPRVVCLEWLEPVYLAGHWVPELIEAAGGEDVGARPGDHSRTWPLDEVAALHPELVIVALCGFDAGRGLAELTRFEAECRARGVSPPSAWGAPVWVLDGNAYTSRPGPRLAEAAERIQSAILGREAGGLVRYC